MSFVFVLFLVLLLTMASNGAEAQREVIVKLSDQKTDARALKAILTPCKGRKKIHRGEHCGSRVEIKAWLDMDDPQTKFLVIDEVYDVRQKQNLRLLHPYMLQVSNIEQSLTVPLNLNQIVEVACEVKESVRRRQSEDGHHVPNRSNLIFYVPLPRRTTTKARVTEKPPESNLEAMSGTYSVEKQKFKLKFNPRGDKQMQKRVTQKYSPGSAIGNINYHEVDAAADDVVNQESVAGYDQKNSRMTADAKRSDLIPRDDYAIMNQPDPPTMDLLQEEIPSVGSDKTFSYHNYDNPSVQQETNEVGISQRHEVERPEFVVSQPTANLNARNNRIIEAKSKLHQKRLDDQLQLRQQLQINRFAPSTYILLKFEHFQVKIAAKLFTSMILVKTRRSKQTKHLRS